MQPLVPLGLVYPHFSFPNFTLISMITPTSKERVDMIARQAKGFLYCVSSIGVSKIQNKIKTNDKLVQYSFFHFVQ